MGVGDAGSEKYEGERERKRANPGGQGGARAKEKRGSQNRIANDVKDENLAENGVLIGLPAQRGKEKIDVDRDGEDGDLQEIEKAKSVDGGGIVFGAGKKHHEDGSGPDEEEDIGRPGRVRGVGDEGLVVGGDGLRGGVEREGDGEEEPELAGVAGRAASRGERADGGEQDDGEVERVGEQQTGDGGADEIEVEDEEQREKQSGCESETRKTTGGEQERLAARLMMEKCTTGSGEW